MKELTISFQRQLFSIWKQISTLVCRVLKKSSFFLTDLERLAILIIVLALNN